MYMVAHKLHIIPIQKFLLRCKMLSMLLIKLMPIEQNTWHTQEKEIFK